MMYLRDRHSLFWWLHSAEKTLETLNFSQTAMFCEDFNEINTLRRFGQSVYVQEWDQHGGLEMLMVAVLYLERLFEAQTAFLQNQIELILYF